MSSSEQTERKCRTCGGDGKVMKSVGGIRKTKDGGTREYRTRKEVTCTVCGGSGKI